MDIPENRAEALDPSRFKTLSAEEQRSINGGRAFCSVIDDDDYGHKFSSLLGDEDHKDAEEPQSGE